MSAPSHPFPPWLAGVWVRRSIRRAGPDGKLGPPCSAVQVRYIQTPCLGAFVDVRRRPDLGTREGMLAFAGLAVAAPLAPREEEEEEHEDEGKAGGDSDDSRAAESALVSWHACLDLDAPGLDAAGCWTDALAGKPRATEDQGEFVPAAAAAAAAAARTWIETAPDGSLEEIWERVAAGGEGGKGKEEGGEEASLFVAAKRGNSILVVAGEYFAVALSSDEDDGAGDPSTGLMFASGRRIKDETGDGSSGAEQWIVELSAPDRTWEGKRLPPLPGRREEWMELPPLSERWPEVAARSLAFDREEV